MREIKGRGFRSGANPGHSLVTVTLGSILIFKSISAKCHYSSHTHGGCEDHMRCRVCEELEEIR